MSRSAQSALEQGALRGQIRFYREHRARGLPLVLASVVDTEGSTYRKTGATMLIAADGRWSGLLSGGCLEDDLAAHALAVLQIGAPRLVSYDLAAMTDTVWGFGLGCEGAVRVLIQRLDCANDWSPYAGIAELAEQGRGGRLALAFQSARADVDVGDWCLLSDQGEHVGPLDRQFLAGEAEDTLVRLPKCIEREGCGILILRVPRIPRLVLLGAGPDAAPLVRFAVMLGWHVTVIDHRQAWAAGRRFPSADLVLHAPQQGIPSTVDLGRADAILIMSHNLEADTRYLEAACTASVPYVGLLGPTARRDKLLERVPAAQSIHGRLYGPVGLDIGADGPEAIALAVVAEIQAVMAGRPGGHKDTSKREEVK